MNENEKSCPFCAETLRAEAVVCPYCRSEVGEPPEPRAYRNRPGRQIAGVATALAAVTGISVTLVRLAFIVSTFVSCIGPVLYAALWLVLPDDPGGVSPLGRMTQSVAHEPAGSPAPLQRFVSWLRPKLDALWDRLRGARRSPEGSP